MTTIFTEHRKRNCEASVRRYDLLDRIDSPKRSVARSSDLCRSLAPDVRLVTTEVILIEVLNFFGEHGKEARLRAVSATAKILTNHDTEVVRHAHESFLAGLDFYKARADKGYSLTDCISMITMRERNILTSSRTIITLSRKVSPFYCSLMKTEFLLNNSLSWKPQ